MIVFNHINEAIGVALASNLKPTCIELGKVKSEVMIEAMDASGGMPDDGGEIYFCGLLVKLHSPIPGISVY